MNFNLLPQAFLSRNLKNSVFLAHRYQRNPWIFLYFIKMSVHVYMYVYIYVYTHICVYEYLCSCVTDEHKINIIKVENEVIKLLELFYFGNINRIYNIKIHMVLYGFYIIDIFYVNIMFSSNFSSQWSPNRSRRKSPVIFWDIRLLGACCRENSGKLSGEFNFYQAK